MVMLIKSVESGQGQVYTGKQLAVVNKKTSGLFFCYSDLFLFKSSSVNSLKGCRAVPSAASKF